MKQMRLATTGFELVTKRTPKRELLDEMNLVIPWCGLLVLIAPHAPAGKTGRPPFATEFWTQAQALLHGEKEVVFADLGYRGGEKREVIQEQHPDVDWQIAMMPSKRKALNKTKPSHALRDKLEKHKAASGPKWSIRFGE